MAAKNNSNEIKLTRVYDAPLARVWEAWTDENQAAQWWGPRGFTITTHKKDFRVGGEWNYTMHGPEDVDFPNITKYLEIEKPSKMVYDHGGTAQSPPMFRVTVLFSEKNGKTTMDMTMALPSPEAAEKTRAFIKQAGGDSTWDRLAEYLDKETTGKDTFVINRSFAAPINVMFDMWTNPDHFGKWIAPKGFSTEFFNADIKPGGKTFYAMGVGQTKMYGRAAYQKIEKPNLIVYTQQFCDEKENVTRHPMSDTWPETMLTTVQLTEEGPNQTRITLSWQCYGKVTQEELDTFIDARAGMTVGWTGSFDKLEEYLVEHGSPVRK
jgi:uncharacterized protein YndB with AHSA1/START domain